MRETDGRKMFRPATAWPAVALTQAAALACLVALLGLSRAADVPFSQLARDPATALGGAFVTGYLSYLGACLWCVAAAVATFAAVLARAGRDPSTGFLLATGLLSLLMLVDDLFMLHDGLVPFVVGDVERLNVAAYLGLGLSYLAAFVRQIRQTCRPLLVAAACAFAVSVFVDVGLIPVRESRRHLFEDGAKFLGITNWAAWVVATSFCRMRRLVATVR